MPMHSNVLLKCIRSKVTTCGRHFHHRDMATSAINNILETFAHRSSKVSMPVLGAGDRIGEGDTYLIENILPRELAEVDSRS